MKIKHPHYHIVKKYVIKIVKLLMQYIYIYI